MLLENTLSCLYLIIYFDLQEVFNWISLVSAIKKIEMKNLIYENKLETSLINTNWILIARLVHLLCLFWKLFILIYLLKLYKKQLSLKSQYNEKLIIFYWRKSTFQSLLKPELNLLTDESPPLLYNALQLCTLWE